MKRAGERPLRVGVLGAGHIAPTHVRAWRKSPRFDLQGIFDLKAESAKRLIEKYPTLRSFDSAEELIESCEVVDICTPPASHFGLLEPAMASGRHIVVEKPIVIAEAEWSRLYPQLVGYPQSISVIHHMKFARSVQTAKRWLAQGRLGRLLRVESYFATHSSVDRMLTDQPHWSHELPGGRWFETLPHNLYLIHFLAGPLELEHVCALETPHAPSGAAADEVAVLLRGPSTLATIHFSANCQHNYRWLNLVGTKGVLRMDLLSGALAFDRVIDRPATRALGRLFLQSCTALARYPADRGRYFLDRLAGRTPHAALVESLGSHLYEDGEPPTSLEEIRYTVEGCYQIGAAIEAAFRKP